MKTTRGIIVQLLLLLIMPKVLITPQGNRMKILFGANWAERVKVYLENN